ncbi:hypothetical protein DL771_008074 [Monosporascus sp. 5C6A]|nr:hypothetical protein DL771_008074 [Monosporascus sp. 5C6A]
MAPNYLDLDYPSLISTCLESHGIWKKTEWHGISGVKVGKKILYNIFSECNPAEHTRIKKPVAKYFSSTGVSVMEPHVNSVLAFFVKRLDDQFTEHAGFGKPLKFDEWASFYAWDTIAQSTWSRRAGHLEHAFDFDGMVDTSARVMDYLVTVGMQPSLDRFLDKNSVFRIGPPSFVPVANAAYGHLLKRRTGEDEHDPSKPDFLDCYLEAMEKYPEVVDEPRLMSYILVNVGAGVDTTATTLRAIFYLSLKHRRVWRKLEAQILSASFTELPVSYSQARAVTYLEAVIRESMRLWPGSCFAQERYVPPGGLTLPDGSFVPEGVAVGFNAYVIHRNKDVWGDDAEDFRPERWLQSEAESTEQFKERLRLMNSSDLSFGAGSRKCLGINFATMEIYKTVATLIAVFEFELADPTQEWKIHNSMFPRQSGIDLKIKRREGVTVPFGMDLNEDY